MQLTNGRVWNLNQILGALVMLDKAQTLKLTGLTRLALVRNIKRIAEATGPIEDTRLAIAKTVGFVSDKETPDKKAQFIAELEKMFAAPCEVRLSVIKASALNLDENGIPMDLILALGEIVEDDLDPDAPKAAPSENVVPIKPAGK